MAGNTKVDIQAYIEDWAWSSYRRKADRKERKLLEKEQVNMELDWKRVQFVHHEPKYEPEVPKPGNGTPLNNCLFHTTFTNKTNQPQSYTFKTERTTSSECTVEIEESYTTGVEMSVTLKTPCEILETNAGFHREQTLTNINGQTNEETMSWGVDSQITVNPHYRAEAKLVILEEEYNGKFTVKTNIKGKVRAVFYNLKDNNAFMKAVEGDAYEIIGRFRNEGRIKGNTVIIDADSRSVVCTTSGKCKFKYGLRQNVEVDHFPVSPTVS